MKEQAEAVQRMQDYIGEHRNEAITLADLARVSLFSPWHSYRLFKQWTGLTPSDYIRRLRLSTSALKLRDGQCRIADVAYEYGFGSVDGYQRAFLREFGCNPREYAANPVPLYLFTPYGVKYREIRKEPRMAEKVRTVFIQVIEKPARKAVIRRGVRAEDYFAYCEEVGCVVWGLLTSMRSLCGEPVCLWLPEKLRKPGTSVYVQGVEVPEDYSGPVPEEFDVIDLPAAKYLMFQGEPFEEEDYCQAIEAVQSAAKEYDPSVIGYRWDRENPRIQLEPVGTRGYIELYAITEA
ncbi:helix-turn-helix domain-containing protein [Enterocloster lavalensis]|uniref:helix-turn-helix domain-containing protein n=1 Tax=Enterocloster lavalensis TaxID=460384 RepID=UPI001D0873CA|nr:AraC family transcriptional regulator [Enterocloster lavalensis]MCB6345008.1 AraC family transcriptional regulator [Enterocloster lavalensis]